MDFLLAADLWKIENQIEHHKIYTLCRAENDASNTVVVVFLKISSYNECRKNKNDLGRGRFEAHLCCRMNRRFRKIVI